MTRAAWVATGIVVAGHVGLGAALYYQRFEMPVLTAPDQPPPFEVTMEPPPRPLPDPEPVKPTPPNTPLNDTPRPVTPTETIAAVPSDATPTESTTVTITEVVDRPVVDATPEPVRPQPPAVIRNPSWSRRPTADQMMRAYPDRAINSGVTGSAALNCLVLPTGAVTDCNVTRETPGGYGFGRAAQGLSRHFRVNPRTVDGAAEGSRVNINLRFNLPED